MDRKQLSTQKQKLEEIQVFLTTELPLIEDGLRTTEDRFRQEWQNQPHDWKLSASGQKAFESWQNDLRLLRKSICGLSAELWDAERRLKKIEMLLVPQQCSSSS
jgi:hypothetical protein